MSVCECKDQPWGAMFLKEGVGKAKLQEYGWTCQRRMVLVRPVTQVNGEKNSISGRKEAECVQQIESL